MDKYNVKTYNSISHLGLEKIKDLGLSIDSGKTANAILLRSHKLSSEEIEEQKDTLNLWCTKMKTW